MKHYHHPPDKHWILPSLVVFLFICIISYAVTPIICNSKKESTFKMDTVKFLGPVQFQCTYCGHYNEQNIYIKPK